MLNKWQREKDLKKSIKDGDKRNQPSLQQTASFTQNRNLPRWKMTLAGQEARIGFFLLTLELNPLLSLKWAPLEEIPTFLSSS